MVALRLPPLRPFVSSYPLQSTNRQTIDAPLCRRLTCHVIGFFGREKVPHFQGLSPHSRPTERLSPDLHACVAGDDISCRTGGTTCSPTRTWETGATPRSEGTAWMGRSRPITTSDRRNNDFDTDHPSHSFSDATSRGRIVPLVQLEFRGESCEA